MAHQKDSPDLAVPEATLRERQELFLLLIEGGAHFYEAAEGIGIHRVTAWRWKQDADFLKRYHKARHYNVAKLRQEAMRRAMAGSDRLLIFLLKCYAPEEFGDRRVRGVPSEEDYLKAVQAAQKRVRLED